MPKRKIFIFTDYNRAKEELGSYGLNDCFTPLSEFNSKVVELVESCDVKNLVIAVTGHGSENGIESESRRPIAVEELVGTLRKCERLELVSLVLGQCYAGLFNFVDARGCPKFTLMGATNLNLSLSSGVRLESSIKKVDGSDGLQTWAANFFLYHFFKWLNNPIDVDGDGKFTMLDAYRFAGVRSNDELASIKGAVSIEVDDLLERRAQVKRILERNTDPSHQLQYELAQKAIEKKLDEELAKLYLHQEPWILSADVLRNTVIDGFQK